MSEKKPKQLFVVYDGRALGGDTDEATVLSSDHTLKGARRDARECGFSPCAIYRYDIGPDGHELINEQFVEAR